MKLERRIRTKENSMKMELNLIKSEPFDNQRTKSSDATTWEPGKGIINYDECVVYNERTGYVRAEEEHSKP